MEPGVPPSDAPPAPGGWLRSGVSALLGALPAAAPAWIYTVLLRPAPLRALANALLRRLIPPTLALPEGVLLLNQEDPVVSGALALGVYETGSLSAWRQVLDRPDMTVLDIGGNIGLYSLIAASRCPASQVIAFEPETRNAAILKAMAQANGFTNLAVVNAGAGAVNGEATLFLDPDNKGKHSLVRDGARQQVTTIALVTIDDTVARHGLSRIDAVKIDVEGWEEQVFLGMGEVLARDHPTLLFEFAPVRIRLAGGDPERLLQRLVGLGYGLAALDEADGARQPVTDVAVFLARFSHRDAYRNVLATWPAESP